MGDGAVANKETKEEIKREKVEKMIALYQERLKKLSEISDFINFFFKKKISFDPQMLQWKGNTVSESVKALKRVQEILEAIPEEEWNKEKLSEVLMAKSDEYGDRGQMLWPLRVALTGKKASASPFDIAEILEKEDTIQKVKDAQRVWE